MTSLLMRAPQVLTLIEFHKVKSEQKREKEKEKKSEKKKKCRRVRMKL